MGCGYNRLMTKVEFGMGSETRYCVEFNKETGAFVRAYVATMQGKRSSNGRVYWNATSTEEAKAKFESSKAELLNEKNHTGEPD